MNTLIIIGHPIKNTFNHALADAIIKGRTYFGSVKVSTEDQRRKWLERAEQLGRRMK